MAYLRCGVCDVDIHEEIFTAHKQTCTKPRTGTGLNWMTSLKRYFSPESSTNQGGRPLKRLKTTPTSFGMGKPSTPSSYNRSASNSPAVFRVSNSPFSRSRGSSPFNARTPNSTPALQPPIEDGLSQPQGMTLAERRSNWQNHLARLSQCVTDSYAENPDWDDRFWDAIAYPSVVYLIPFLQTLRIYEFEVKDLNDACLLQFDIAFGFDESRPVMPLNLENYWDLVKRLQSSLGEQEFRITGKYCSNTSFDRSTHGDRRENNFFTREWTIESETFPSTAALATHLHSMAKEDLPFQWTDVLRIWLRFAHQKIYDEEIEKDASTAEPVSIQDADSEYDAAQQEDDSDEEEETESDEAPIPPDLLKKIQDDYYEYKKNWKQLQPTLLQEYDQRKKADETHENMI